ncbi:MAG TPA: fumarate hydratase C-terminal domain-containing protein [Caulobacteraceae bacterium]|jgi:fumarate hydratase subunit beta|nr:fumarate hydratase C-terminal domain-containing protein [Caulobacteraceae bacterium]
MQGPKAVSLPISEAEVRSLHAGDLITLNGEITITAGMPTHERMLDYLRRGEPLPFGLEGGSLLHLGGYSHETPGGPELVYMNPTTSTRFNPYMPELIRGFGLRVTGGKGGLDVASARAMQEVGCVYLSFLGGGCTLLSQAIRKVEAVYWDDLIVHYRVTRLQVEGLGPVTVGIDAHGRSLYEEGAHEAADRLPDILAGLAAARASAPSAT